MINTSLLQSLEDFSAVSTRLKRAVLLNFSESISLRHTKKVDLSSEIKQGILNKEVYYPCNPLKTDSTKIFWWIWGLTPIIEEDKIFSKISKLTSFWFSCYWSSFSSSELMVDLISCSFIFKFSEVNSLLFSWRFFCSFSLLNFFISVETIGCS